MKKQVNGLTFDEVFEERGKEIKVSEMVKDRVYLCDQLDVFGWLKLIKFKGVAPSRYNIDILTSTILYSDGDDGDDNPGLGMKIRNAKAFYEATPNQIALLNAHKNANE